MALSKVIRSVSSLRTVQKMKKWGGWMAVVDPDYYEIDPFIFLVHHKHSFEADSGPQGFPGHPHKGFATLTYVLEGGFDHGDSRGNRGRYGPGDMQFMSAGTGVLHSEMFIIHKTKKTYFDGFQLWLNLPAVEKSQEPGYLMLWDKENPWIEVPSSQAEEEGQSHTAPPPAKVKLLAGKIGDRESPVKRSFPFSYMHVVAPPGASFEYETPQAHHAFFYVIQGLGVVGQDQRKVTAQQYGLLKQDGNVFRLHNPAENSEELSVLFFEGRPLNEPFAHKGPFVMNTSDELRRAFLDFQLGKFGSMEEIQVGEFDGEDGGH